MEEHAYHLEYVIVLMIGVETTAPYVCDSFNCLGYYYILFCYKAVCPAGCFNGGNCTSPGMCTCPYGWTGNDCSQGIKYVNVYFIYI